MFTPKPNSFFNFSANKIIMKKIFSLLLLLVVSYSALAQERHAFWDDIQSFKKSDADHPPPKSAILLIGSSSFTKWTDVGTYFPNKTFINRGFGGSTLKDLNFYSDDLLKPYSPKQIIIYCGENDFAADQNVAPKEVFNRFKKFYATIRKYYPKIPVDYISIKFSPSRKNLWPKMAATNQLIENFMKRKPNADYIDITKSMETPDGKIRKDLFLEDMLHMKPEGYELWKKEMEPYLK